MMLHAPRPVHRHGQRQTQFLIDPCLGAAGYAGTEPASPSCLVKHTALPNYRSKAGYGQGGK